MGFKGSVKMEIGLGGAVLLGLGSILGSGVFIALGIAAEVTGPALTVALVPAAFLAMLSGFSAAQLASAHPVSGGTYEYGHRFLNATWGFLAGWLYLLAKGASAATAALGVSGYLVELFSNGGANPALGGILAVFVCMAVILLGIRRTNLTNGIGVAVTLIALLAFINHGLHHTGEWAGRFTPFFNSGHWGRSAVPNFLTAIALLTVAFTGHGRIATLSELAVKKKRTITTALVLSLLIALALYAAVALSAVGLVGTRVFAESTRFGAAPLQVVAERIGTSKLQAIVAIGAVTALFGVLMNLVLGVSRVVVAMGRRGDLPQFFALLIPLEKGSRSPAAAIVVAAVFIATLAMFGSVRSTWSLSAFTLLMYSAVTNWAALKMPRSGARYPRWMAWTGIGMSLILSLFIDTDILVFGIFLMGVGLFWHTFFHKVKNRARK